MNLEYVFGISGRPRFLFKSFLDTHTGILQFDLFLACSTFATLIINVPIGISSNLHMALSSIWHIPFVWFCLAFPGLGLSGVTPSMMDWYWYSLSVSLLPLFGIGKRASHIIGLLFLSFSGYICYLASDTKNLFVISFSFFFWQMHNVAEFWYRFSCQLVVGFFS